MQFKQMMHPRWLAVMALAIPLAVSAGALEQAVDAQVSTDKAAQKSQQNIDKLDDQTREMLQEYREVIRQTQSLHAYNEQLEHLVRSQQAELQSISLQLKNVETTQRDIVPLMLKMVDVLEEFVQLDIPFLPNERHSRIVALKTMMGRADVSLAEKYRRIMEAYQVETEYGRTIEAYQGDLIGESEPRTVDFLRIGRVSLYYLSLDGMEAGVWDADSKQWQTLDDNYLQPLTDGLKVARKQLPPDLLVLPVKTVGGVQ